MKILIKHAKSYKIYWLCNLCFVSASENCGIHLSLSIDIKRGQTEWGFKLLPGEFKFEFLQQSFGIFWTAPAEISSQVQLIASGRVVVTWWTPFNNFIWAFKLTVVLVRSVDVVDHARERPDEPLRQLGVHRGRVQQAQVQNVLPDGPELLQNAAALSVHAILCKKKKLK